MTTCATVVTTFSILMIFTVVMTFFLLVEPIWAVVKAGKLNVPIFGREQAVHKARERRIWQPQPRRRHEAAACQWPCRVFLRARVVLRARSADCVQRLCLGSCERLHPCCLMAR